MNDGAESERAKPSFWAAFSSPRLALMLGFGFAAGLPNPLTGSTLTAWLDSTGADLTVIGLFAYVRVPYNIKFLWAPLLDRYRLPFLSRRRGWIALTQLALVVTIGVMGTLDPRNAPWLVAAMAMAVAFSSASQDIVSDAYRTDLLHPEHRASGTAIFVAAYRGALIAAGAGALVLSDHVSWTVVYAVMAALILVSSVVTFIAPPPDVLPKPPATLVEAVIDPFREFVSRKDAAFFLVIVAFYKIGDGIVSHFLIPFLTDVGFTRTDIGAIQKGFGLGATIVGAMLGGGFVAKWGLRRALIVFGVLQAVANLGYLAVAFTGKSYSVVTVVIGLDHLFNGMGTAAFVALLMTLCNKRFTAFQYALLSSLTTVPKLLLTAPGGWLADNFGWTVFFVATVILSVPAVFMLVFLEIPEPQGDGEAEAA